MRSHWQMLYAARFVAKWEGWLPEAYLDTLASPDIWTQGYGHTRYAGRPYPPDGVWSKAKGLRVLSNDLRSAARAVNQKVHVKLTFRQRIALISIVFNCGAGVLDDPDIMVPLNKGKFSRAAVQMLDWNHAGGVEVQGLTNRRHAEAWMMTHSKLRDPRPAQKPPKVHHHHRAHKKPRR